MGYILAESTARVMKNYQEGNAGYKYSVLRNRFKAWAYTLRIRHGIWICQLGRRPEA